MEYTLSVFTENKIGLLNRITIVFNRRHVNIESLSTSESEIPGIHRFNIVVQTSLDMVQKLVAQLEKQIEVIKAFYHAPDEVAVSELALYKISPDAFQQTEALETIVRENHARILSIHSDYLIIEKTGNRHGIRRLFDQLEPFGILEFARSGQISVSRPENKLTSYLKAFEKGDHQI
jgi:acetolactate synthase-1/3 small subunit